MTAVEWLIEQCPRINTIASAEVIEQAKEMEKEQQLYSIGTIATDGVVSVNADNYTFTYNGTTKRMPKKVIQVMHYFVTNKSRVITRDELLKNVWGDEIVVGERTIDVHIRKIRSIISNNCITTLVRIGYKWN